MEKRACDYDSTVGKVELYLLEFCFYESNNMFFWNSFEFLANGINTFITWTDKKE